MYGQHPKWTQESKKKNLITFTQEFDWAIYRHCSWTEFFVVGFSFGAHSFCARAKSKPHVASYSPIPNQTSHI
jgi:alpha/beta superfamily hydrolase